MDDRSYHTVNQIKTDFKVTKEQEQEECKKYVGKSTSTITSDLQFQANTKGEVICYQLLHN